MALKGMSVQAAAQAAIDEVGKIGGTGGLIALDRQGNMAMPFNTSGMYRGSVDASGKISVEIYRWANRSKICYSMISSVTR